MQSGGIRVFKSPVSVPVRDFLLLSSKVRYWNYHTGRIAFFTGSRKGAIRIGSQDPEDRPEKHPENILVGSMGRQVFFEICAGSGPGVSGPGRNRKIFCTGLCRANYFVLAGPGRKDSTRSGTGPMAVANATADLTPISRPSGSKLLDATVNERLVSLFTGFLREYPLHPSQAPGIYS